LPRSCAVVSSFSGDVSGVAGGVTSACWGASFHDGDAMEMSSVLRGGFTGLPRLVAGPH
jgi:hypothetical protein